MIVTESALAIILDTFAPVAALPRRVRGRDSRRPQLFASQAYDDGAFPAAKRFDAGVTAITSTSAMQRRETPLR
jgi:hypothetical protein